MEMVETDPGLVPEKLRHCPECKKKNILSLVERLQYEEDRYWVCCTRKDSCSFLEEFRGKAVISLDDLNIYGLPGQLLEHVDIFYEDINKIVRLCMSEYIKQKFLTSSTTDYDLNNVKDSIRILSQNHNLDNYSVQTEEDGVGDRHLTEEEKSVTIVNSDLKVDQNLVETAVEPSSLGILNQLRESEKSTDFNLTAGEETSQALTGFHNATSLTQSASKNPLDKSEGATDEDLLQLLRGLDSETSQLIIKNNETTLSQKQGNNILGNRNKNKKHDGKPESYKAYDLMKKLADTLVIDLPLDFQEAVKTAFSKIDGYNFPQDFVNDTTPDKLPLFKILEERQRQERIKAEVEEQLNKFMAEIDGFDSLLC